MLSLLTDGGMSSQVPISIEGTIIDHLIKWDPRTSITLLSLEGHRDGTVRLDTVHREELTLLPAQADSTLTSTSQFMTLITPDTALLRHRRVRNERHTPAHDALPRAATEQAL